jgi:hypothetical protein
MTKVYISYSRRNKLLIFQIVEDLLKIGFNVCVDFLKLHGGTVWANKLDQELQEADIFVVFLSQDALNSSFVRDEILKARQQNKLIVPVSIDQMGFIFSHLQNDQQLSWMLDLHIISFDPQNYPVSFDEVLRALALQPKIFISYRRKDSADVCDRIYGTLVKHFGKDCIVRDIDNIPLGVDFRDYLSGILRQSVVELVVIGPEWVSITDEAGNRRLDNPADFVRLEVETAINRKVFIIPVTVMNANLPQQQNLPQSLQPLVYRNGMAVRRDPDYKGDMERLIKGIEQRLAIYK